MTKKHRIPNRLFVEAGRRVEEALRRDTSEAIAQFGRDDDLIATLEEDKVVLLRGPEFSLGTLPELGDAPPDVTAEGAAAEYKLQFLNLVTGVSPKIYISGERLYIEFPRGEKEVGDFLSAPENQDILRDVCRELAGREMTTYLMFFDETAPPRPLLLRRVRLPPVGPQHGDRGAFIINRLRVIAAMLRAAGDSTRAAQVENILARRSARQPLSWPGFYEDPLVDVLLDRPRRHHIMHEEGDPDPSRKSGE
jgi:hypothetical protein